MGHMHHYYDDIPTQDQCKGVNVSEPNECPMIIGPPCPPCYTNINNDYINGDSLDYTDNNKESMINFAEFYNDYIMTHYPPPKINGGYDIYAGLAGRGQIFLRQYLYNTSNIEFLNIADEYVDAALKILPKNSNYGSFMAGNIGPYTIKAIIENIQGNNYMEYLDTIINYVKNVNIAIMENDTITSDGVNMTMLDQEHGLSGMIYDGILLNTWFDKDIINPQSIYNISKYVLDHGIIYGLNHNNNYLMYPFFDNAECYLYGVNNGASGVIHQLYNAFDKYPTIFSYIFTNDKYYNAIKNTLDFYVSIQLPDGNIPENCEGACSIYYGNDSDSRVQYCHGAPGFINVFAKSALLFANINATAAQIYLNTAIVTANVTWNRGLLVKGTMFCHGIGGNINMFWNFANILSEIEALNSEVFNGYNLIELKNQMFWRSKQFVLWTLNWNNINKTRIYDSNEGFSMFGGNFAIQMIYVKLLQNEWYNNEMACQPGWNICI